MHISRLYTAKGQDIFATKEYRLMNSVIRASDGSVISKLDNLEMPADWSQNACDIFAHKYLRKAGVPEKLIAVPEQNVPAWLYRHIAATDESNSNATKIMGETSIKQAINRIAGCWTYHGWKGGYFDTEDDALAFFDEIKYMLLHQICSPNSPQWFNTGLHWAYGISGIGAGHYHYCMKTNQIVAAKTAYEHPQVHACFILSVEDNLLGKDGIMDTWLKEAAIFKYGSGAGANFSNLRAAGERLSGGGRSSGLMSFLKIGDTAAGAIKSGGTTRRAAKMVILNDDHPDIEQFIAWKVNEEQKVLSLVLGSMEAKKNLKAIEQACRRWSDLSSKYDLSTNPYLSIAFANAQKIGIPLSYCNQVLYMLQNDIPVEFEEFNFDWNSHAYLVVSGQNSNNSIRVTDKFLKAIKDDESWELKARTDGAVLKTLRARDLWKKICFSAWSCADPGVQFDDTIQAWHTCKASGRITATNPCSEYVFLDNTACNLASVNLDKMLISVKDKLTFDIKSFEHVCRLLTLSLEISIFMAQYPTYEIALKSCQFRTLGLGYASLGSSLMKLGLAYDSAAGRDLASAITALMTWTAYDTSAEIAKDLGAFSEYEQNKEHLLRVLQHMKNATDDITYKKDASLDDIDEFHMLQFKDMTDDSRFADLNVLPATLKMGPMPELTKYVRELANKTMDKVQKYGVRNAQTTLIAPTGTISFIMDCGTTACEPAFSLVSWKRLAGGGDMRVLNPEVISALHALGYKPNQVTDIKNYIFGHGNLKDCAHINNQMLLDKGLKPHMITKLEEGLQNCYHIDHILNIHYLGLEELQKIFPYLTASSDLLQVLGFTKDQINQANLHCCGHLTIEGAPHLHEDHVEIFDCAVNNGVGVRYIKPMGHVKMLAAIQPFISGASSKTVNMPEEATIDDISNIYLNAWSMGVKCIALYRNNCKFSQALNITSLSTDQSQTQTGQAFRYGMRLNNQAFYVLTQQKADGTLQELEIVMGKEGSSFRVLLDCFAQAISLGLKHNVPLIKYIEAFKNTAFEPAGLVNGYDGIDKALSPLDLLAKVLEKEYSGKEQNKTFVNVVPLAQTCKSRRMTVEVAGHQFTLHTGETDDGQLGEVFFKMSKEGSSFCSLMSNFAKAISIALQAGVPFEVIYNTFIGTKFEPYGVVKGHTQITSADSVIDFAFKCLASWYYPDLLDWQDMKTDFKQLIRSEPSSGVSSNPCSKCSSFTLISNGSCFVCSNCGETTGCS